MEVEFFANITEGNYDNFNVKYNFKERLKFYNKNTLKPKFLKWIDVKTYDYEFYIIFEKKSL